MNYKIPFYLFICLNNKNLNYLKLWFLSELEKKCGLCFGLSLYAVFIYSIDWIFLTFTIHNLYKIITDPIQGILRPTLRLRFYTFTSFFSAVAVTLLTYMAKVYGRSVRIYLYEIFLHFKLLI